MGAAHPWLQAVLVELRLDQAEREPGRDHLPHLDLAEHVGQCTDVVLVPMGEDDGAHGPVVEIGEVGQHEIHAEVLVSRERKPCIDEDPLLAELVDRHVLADLAEAAQRDDAQHVWHG